ncbi:dsRNA-specific ribonuclease III dicer [Mucor lusitanicus]|uniref:DsRNA-specific ribonuclease III dicer n=1 Tax=Mucor circinelloides f. lusitanicus TaxID=29924 RepID=A0A8H4BAQ8_MUCCL|nr:dsRNA-specific ribonuclease III dicer [Mucor lusitanicus]
MTIIYLDPEFSDLTPEQVEHINQEKKSSLETVAGATLEPREYQYEIFKKAVSENTIAVLDTGAGKTLIAVMLIKHMLALEREKLQANRDYRRKVTFFLVDRVHLVFQQASVIRANCDAQVKELCGDMNVDAWKADTWTEIWDNNDICVLTAQIFLDNLRSGFLTLDRVNIMVFDECHHASKGHPFNLIMIEFYHRIYDNPVNQALDKPKIFGMTASPIHTSSKKVLESISTLETSLQSIVYTAKSTQELASAVKKPFETELFYSMDVINDVPPSPVHAARDYIRRERYQRSILTTLITNKINQVTGFQQCLNAIIYISNNLGPWCSDRLWKSILYKANTKGLFTPTLYTPEQKLSNEDQQLLQEAYELCSITDNNTTEPDLTNERQFTPKARVLVDCLKDILANDANKQGFCGIIFVDRRHTAVAIKILIESISVFKEDIRCDVLIGHGVKSGGDLQMKYTKQNEVIAKFRAGELNLLIATNVAEEGLDIQACNYVIRFDLFKTVIAYIQSRGRARRKDSKYILMLNRQNLKDMSLLRNVVRAEEMMKDYCRMLPKDRNLAVMFDDASGSPGTEYHPEYIKQGLSDKYLQDAFCIESTGALLTRSNAIALIYHYCATLPSDNFCNFKPVYEYEDLTNYGLSLEEIEALDLPSINPTTVAGKKNIFGCTLTLPINARIQQFRAYDRAKDDAKARVSLQACVALYKAGDIDSHLVPKSKTQRRVLMDLAEEKDDNGKLIGSRGRENLYKKKQPLFWQGDDLVDGTDARLGPYWISLIGIDLSAQQQQLPPYRPMCLITKKPLPAIPSITLYNNNKPFQVHLTSQSEALSFNKQTQVDDLMEYTFSFLKCITNKTFTCAKNNIEYLVAPLIISDTAAQQTAKIDWVEITKSIADKYLPVNLHSNGILDTILVDTSDQKKRQYFVQSVQHDMTPLSPVPDAVSTSNGLAKKLREHGYATFKDYYEDQEFLSKKITDMAQPLIQVHRVPKNQSFRQVRGSSMMKKRDREPESVVHWLVPELCLQYPISASVYQTLQLVPDIMMHIDAVLLMHDAKKALGLSGRMKDPYMLEAFTASSAGLEKDYQRLEFLGDSVLKFITSTYVFVTLPISNEFELTESRMRMISNTALFKSAIQLRLYEYICSQNLPRRFYRPPNYLCKDDSAEMIKSLTYHKLSDKTLADVVESTLGASYLSCLGDKKQGDQALNEALHTTQRLLVPMQKMEQWSDFQTIYRDERDNKQLKMAAYDPLFDQRIDIKKVSRILGYEFQNEALIAEALTHASVTNSSVPCYQRLEFLGDAVLDFCVTNYLFEKYHTAPPGTLHDLRKSSVNNDILSVLCIQLGLHVHIRHFSTTFPSAVKQFQELVVASQDEKGEYWLNFNPPKVLSDVVESLIGAVFVDAGFNLDPVLGLFDRLLKPLLDDHISIEAMQQHPLGKLKCMVQEFGCKQCETRNVYSATLGQCCVVFIHGQAFASGSGVNTKEARKEAAAKACQRIQDNPDEFIAKCTCL